MFGMMPLACIYYPVTVLPHWLQYVAWALPPTYVFEGMRALLTDHVFRADLMLEALAINVVLLLRHLRYFLRFCAARGATARCSRAANKPRFPVDFAGFSAIAPCTYAASVH